MISIRHASRSAMVLLVVTLCAALVGAGCGSSKTADDSKAVTAKGKCPKATGSDPLQFDTAPASSIVDASAEYTATLTTSEGVMTAKLFPKDAPNAVSNFVFLARNDFYSDIPFHRIIEDFMVQTGDPTGTGAGGPGYTIDDDDVDRDYSRGTLAMANTGAPNSAGSQFFIVHKDYDLPPTYAIFGSVVDGLSVLDKIAGVDVENSPSGEPSSPVKPVTLESVTVDGPELAC